MTDSLFPTVLLVSALLLLPLAVLLALNALSRLYRVELTADETHRTTTDDGWTLVLSRWKPKERPSAARAPVILCHGLGVSALCFDLAERVSLARFLAGRGFDVWAVDLRGRTGSDPPPGTGRHAYWLDDHVARDVPAAIAFVRGTTGASRVSWVGHSMGGIVIYAHAEATQGGDLACAVTIASPTALADRPVLAAGAFLLRGVVLPALHAGFFARALAPFAGLFHPWRVGILLDWKNVDRTVVRSALASAIVDVPVRILRQLAAWVGTGRLVSRDGERVYFSRLSSVRTPWLVVAGRADRIVPWRNARAGYESLGSERKRWLLLGEEEGYPVDYGHGDLIASRDAAREVFAPIADFLEEFGR